MKLKIDKFEVRTCNIQRILWDMGMDVTKEIKVYEEHHNPCSLFYHGTARPPRITGFIETVVGRVPITQPWEAIGG